VGREVWNTSNDLLIKCGMKTNLSMRNQMMKRMKYSSSIGFHYPPHLISSIVFSVYYYYQTIQFHYSEACVCTVSNKVVLELFSQSCYFITLKLTCAWLAIQLLVIQSIILFRQLIGKKVET
jgi:hypothetical protein